VHCSLLLSTILEQKIKWCCGKKETTTKNQTENTPLLTHNSQITTRKGKGGLTGKVWDFITVSISSSHDWGRIPCYRQASPSTASAGALKGSDLTADTAAGQPWL